VQQAACEGLAAAETERDRSKADGDKAAEALRTRADREAKAVLAEPASKQSSPGKKPPESAACLRLIPGGWRHFATAWWSS
jgi:hypothetical protein